MRRECDVSIIDESERMIMALLIHRKFTGISFLFLCVSSIFISCEVREPENLVCGLGDYSIEIVTPPGEEIDIHMADGIFNDVEERISMLDPINGEIFGRLNTSETGELIPTERLDGTISDLLAYSQECYGAFDPTLQILWDVYDFDMGGRRVSDSELADALQWVGYSQIDMDRGSIYRMGEHVRMGLGPVMPGAVADWTRDMLIEKGMESGILRADRCFTFWGDIREKNRIYEFKYPLDKIAEDAAQLTMGYIRIDDGEFLSAIDDDEKFFFSRGKQYHMVLDPVSGKPVESIRAAVIVSDESHLQASVFAYAVMVMGLDRGLEFLDETDGVSGLILTENHEVHVSGELADRFWR